MVDLSDESFGNRRLRGDLFGKVAFDEALRKRFIDKALDLSGLMELASFGFLPKQGFFDHGFEEVFCGAFGLGGEVGGEERLFADVFLADGDEGMIL